MARERFLVVVLAVAVAGAGPALGADVLPANRARMYARPSKETWRAVLDTLTELKLKPDTIDRDTQTLVTHAASYGGKTVRAPELPGYVVKAFRLHIFVSPFAEPARVHIGSVSDAGKHGGGSATYYNGGIAEEWFLTALERRLGQPGRPIPAAADARAALARELTGQEPCVPAGPDRMEQPRKIAASVLEVEYPGPATRQGGSGPVVLELNVGEDGAVYGLQVLKSPDPSLQFRESAVGATQLVRYVPARLKGCPVMMSMTYTVNYRLR
jgi:TonB family protein